MQVTLTEPLKGIGEEGDTVELPDCMAENLIALGLATGDDSAGHPH